MKKNLGILIGFVCRWRWIWLCILIPLLSAVMHHRIFMLDIQATHAWRQAETQTVIRNFAERDMNILNPRVNDHGDRSDIFRMEFPLMQWIYALFFKVFGEHIFISRLLTFITGIIAVIGFYKLSYTLTKDVLVSLAAAWAFNFGPSFYFYTLNPMPDTLALSLSVWGLVYFFRYTQQHSWHDIVLCMVLFSLSTLIKLPFILYFSLPAIYEIIQLVKAKFSSTNYFLRVAATGLLILSPAIAWYVWVIPGWKGNGIVGGIFLLKKGGVYDLIEIIRYTLFEMFPELLAGKATIPVFLLGLILIFWKRLYKNRLSPILIVWGFVTLLYYIFEANMIGKWHDYYLFPFLPQIFLIVLIGFYYLLKDRRPVLILSAAVCILCMPDMAASYSGTRWQVNGRNLNADFITYKNDLKNAVPDSSLVVVANDVTPFVYLYYIHKKGWVVDNYWLVEDSLIDHIQHGARYFYSDVRAMENDYRLNRHFKRMVMLRGSVHVYELQP